MATPKQGVSKSTPDFSSMKPPDQMDFLKPQEWCKWIRRFERYRLASGLSNCNDKQQVSTLIYCMGDEADDLLAALDISTDNASKYDAVKKKFDQHFKVKKNVIFERANFFKRAQNIDEQVDVFINEIYKMADSCDFGILKEEMIRDRIVVGIKDCRLSEVLQMDADLTLTTAVAKVRQAESVHAQQELVRNSENVAVEVVQTRYKENFNRKKSNGSNGNQQRNLCRKCGAMPWHSWENCPAKDAVCHKCRKKGHYQRVCTTKVSIQELALGNNINCAADDNQGNEESFYICSIRGVTRYKPWLVNVDLNGNGITFKVDTGADVSVIGRQTAENMNIQVNTNNIAKLYGPGKFQIPVVGYFEADMQYKSKSSKQLVYVVDGHQDPLLGRPAIQALDILQFSCAEICDMFNEFPRVFNGLGKMKQEYSISVIRNSIPYAVNTPRRIPIQLREKVKIELNRMVKEGVIEPIDMATEWCAPMVAVLKKNMSVRICVDFTELNKYVIRERMVLPSVDETLAQMGGAKVFSKLDASSGFWQIPLDKKSSILTTFVTPFGRFKFLRLPFGLNSSPEHFQKRIAQVIDGLPGVVNLMDDIIVYGQNYDEHDTRLRVVLSKLQEANITMNKEKCEFRRTKTKFLGHILDENGVKPDPDKTAAIANMPNPVNVSDVRRFLGMVNYLRKFVPSLSEKAQAIQELLCKNKEFLWTENHNKCFVNIKNEIEHATSLILFNPNYVTRVSADASNFGIGAVIEQCNKSLWLPVSFASRTLSETEQRYSQIEKEALAIVYACEKFEQYLIGGRFEINTDHKPLLQILKSKPITELSARLQRFRMRLSKFDYEIKYTSGKEFFVPDTLSRAPMVLNKNEGADVLDDNEIFVLEEFRVSNCVLDRIRLAQNNDAVCQNVKQYVVNGWPKSKMPAEFFQVKDLLTVQDGILLKGVRIYIPAVLREEMLAKIHDGHFGVTRCRARAKDTVWWPGISMEIKNMVVRCETCLQHRRICPEPLIPTAHPDRPFKQVGIDLFEVNRSKFLCLIDYFSKYIEIIELKRTLAKDIINHSKGIFARHGIPEIVRTDNGPQFCGEFKQFATQYGFQHITSSPRFPQSNGQVESAVGIAERILKKCKDPYLGLLAYRSTPLECGYSPAELLFGRKLRSTLPSIARVLKPVWPDINVVKEKFYMLKNRQCRNFNSGHKSKDLPVLQSGDRVWVPDQKKFAVVVKSSSEPRSYIIQTDIGTLRRNRAQLLVDSNQVPVGSSSLVSSLPPSELNQSPVSSFSMADSSPPVGNVYTRRGRLIRPPRRLDL